MLNTIVRSTLQKCDTNLPRQGIELRTSASVDECCNYRRYFRCETVTPVKGCYTVANTTLLYPECCPRLVCPPVIPWWRQGMSRHGSWSPFSFSLEKSFYLYTTQYSLSALVRHAGLNHENTYLFYTVFILFKWIAQLWQVYSVRELAGITKPSRVYTIDVCQEQNISQRTAQLV